MDRSVVLISKKNDHTRVWVSGKLLYLASPQPTGPSLDILTRIYIIKAGVCLSVNTFEQC